MPILSNFPTCGADPERYATITFYDWDDTLIGSIAVKKGADASDAVAAFEDAHKADTFDAGSQFYSSDKTKPLTNKKGYTFEGVWLDNDSDVRTHYGVTTTANTTIEKPAGVSFENVTEDMVVKACYGSNDECVRSPGDYQTEVAEYGRYDTANYYASIRVRRKNAAGQGVPRVSEMMLRIMITPTAAPEANLFFFAPMKNTDEQTVIFRLPSSVQQAELNLIEAYSVKNPSSAGVRSSNLVIKKGSAEEKDGFVFLGDMRYVNAALEDAAKDGLATPSGIASNIIKGLGLEYPSMSAARRNLLTAWKAKNPGYDQDPPPAFSDLTWEEMQYAIQNEGELLPEIQSLANTSWEQIDAISRAGLATAYWSVGDEKDIVVNGETLTMQIYGFNHDDITGGGKAGITFGLKNLMAETRAMNSTDTNAGGFTGSEMYTWLQGDLLSGLPGELQGVIKFVDKKTSAGNQSTDINTDSMKIFLFSSVETGLRTTTDVYKDEGETYPIFTDNSSLDKRVANGTGSANGWWERSPYTTSSYHFCTVSPVSIDKTSNGSASGSNGVCFGFCV